jgi:hypothetical protein
VYQLALWVEQELEQKYITLVQDQHFVCLTEETLFCVEDLYGIHKVIMIFCGLIQADQIMLVSLLLNYS